MQNINTQAVRGAQEELGKNEFPCPRLILNSAIHLDSIEDGLDMLTNGVRDNTAYQRYSNPTVRVLEKQFSLMEGALDSIAVNSGMTAINLIFRSLLKSGDHVVTQHGLYHEISDQLKIDYEFCGISTTFVEDYSVETFVSSFQENTKMVFIEVPTNPTFFDVDILALADACNSRKILLVVDNTLLTHLLCKPLNLGASLTIYSLTKTINGHGDVMGGIISSNDIDILRIIQNWRDNTGVILDPFSAWLTIRGLRTLPLRLSRHEKNAEKVIEFFKEKYPEILVRYGNAGKHVKKNGIIGCGGVISIDLPNKQSAQLLVRNLKLFKLATTFGNLESLCYHFASFARPSRDISKIGIPDGLVRLSIGIEDIEDIISDLESALRAAI